MLPYCLRFGQGAVHRTTSCRGSLSFVICFSIADTIALGHHLFKPVMCLLPRQYPMRPNAESVACGEFSCKAANPDLGEYVNGFCACTCADSMYMVNALRFGLRDRHESHCRCHHGMHSTYMHVCTTTLGGVRILASRVLPCTRLVLASS